MHQAYEKIKEEHIEDVHADAVLLRHRKSGARIALLSCDDENKVFSIGFRTPPKDSTGVAHIIEHTVLCGSEKYPVKDPFVELLKGSLCTFLNAMTYPDKTLYPVASCNNKDFRNLMSVYMDAVFRPNIYHTDKFFLQEGWHYHLENKDEPLRISGVVYNEMKGAMSSADDVIAEKVHRNLYPDTPYSVTSGGDPKYIPELTYEQFLDFHKTYYHPSNSYLYLYGDMDMEERLDWLDREYLSGFDRLEVDSEIPAQTPFAEPVAMEIDYPVLDDEPVEENTYLLEGISVGDFRDCELIQAFDVLAYVLLQAPGAPVRQALLDAGIGKDVSGDYIDGTRQPIFQIQAQNAEAERKDEFLRVIRSTLARIVEEGLDATALAAGINYFEFRFREADYGYPRGLMYMIDAMGSWLYDDDMPFDRLHRLGIFEKLKAHAADRDGYFEGLIRTYLLENPHRLVLTARPKRGLTARREKELADRLAAVKVGLREEEIENIVRVTKELEQFQEQKETEEALRSLPVLAISDLQKETPIRLRTKRFGAGEIPILHQVYDTHGIAYLNLLFDASKVPDELTGYLGLMKSVLGFVDTEEHGYGSLFHEINANTGGLHNVLQAYPAADPETPSSKNFMMQIKYLYDKQDFAFGILREILAGSNYTDTKRLREIVQSRKAKMQYSLPAGGSATAGSRAASYFSEASAWKDRTGGVGYYRLLEELTGDFEAHAPALVATLQDLAKILFRPENLTVSITAEEGKEGDLRAQVEALKNVLCTEEIRDGAFSWKEDQKNEAFKTSGQVQYVATAGNFRRAGYPYDGAMNVLRMILNLDYLWTEIRVKGGAYGMGCQFGRTGVCVFNSYRDPHLRRTVEKFREIPAYLSALRADARDMTKYIIGAIGMLDEPLSAAAKGELALSTCYTGLTEEDFQREREELLLADVEKIRSFAPVIEAVLAQGNLCVVGGETAIEKHAEMFKTTEALIRG